MSGSLRLPGFRVSSQPSVTSILHRDAVHYNGCPKAGDEMLRWIAIFVLVLWVLVALASATASYLAQDLRKRGRKLQPKPADTAIILGAYTDGFRPSFTLTARLRAGLRLYRAGYVSYFIVSGGRGEDETVSESRSMKRFLVLNGVPPEYVLEDRTSTDTWENLRNSQQVMERNGLITAVVVTSDYHLVRAMAVAKQLEMKATGFAAWSSRDEFRFALREVAARIKYTLSGQASLL